MVNFEPVFAASSASLNFADCAIVHIIFPYRAETPPPSAAWKGKLEEIASEFQTRPVPPTPSDSAALGWVSGDQYWIWAGAMSHPDLEVREAAAETARTIFSVSDLSNPQFWQQTDSFPERISQHLPMLLTDPSPASLETLLAESTNCSRGTPRSMEHFLYGRAFARTLPREMWWDPQEGSMNGEWAKKARKAAGGPPGFPPAEPPVVWNGDLDWHETASAEKFVPLRSRVAMLCFVMEGKERRNFVRQICRLPHGSWARTAAMTCPQGASEVPPAVWEETCKEQVERDSDGDTGYIARYYILLCPHSPALQNWVDAPDPVFAVRWQYLRSSPCLTSRQLQECASRVLEMGLAASSGKNKKRQIAEVLLSWEKYRKDGRTEAAEFAEIGKKLASRRKELAENKT